MDVNDETHIIVIRKCCFFGGYAFEMVSVDGGSSEFIESLSVTIRRKRRNRKRNHNLSLIAMKCDCHIVHVAISFEIVEHVCVAVDIICITWQRHMETWNSWSCKVHLLRLLLQLMICNLVHYTRITRYIRAENEPIKRYVIFDATTRCWKGVVGWVGE